MTSDEKYQTLLDFVIKIAQGEYINTSVEFLQYEADLVLTNIGEWEDEE